MNLREASFVVFFVACATPPPPPVTPPPAPTRPLRAAIEVSVPEGREVADGVHPTSFQRARVVGHYSTPDGKIGFVLDRTSEPPRIRFDGSPYVLELTPQRASRGVREYVAAGIWLRLDETTGRVMSFARESPAGPVVRDADAEPLPSVLP